MPHLQLISQDLIFWINGNTDISRAKMSVSLVHTTMFWKSYFAQLMTWRMIGSSASSIVQ